MICEETTAPEQERFRLFAAIRLLAGRERFLQTTEASIRRFETVYQKRIRQSFQIVLIVLPLLFMTLMFTVGGSRMLFLVLWISSLVALMVFQILIEYFREHLDRQRRMAEMSDQELLQLLNRQKEPEEEETAEEEDAAHE
jgi:predicted lysophospholipase L1 biosynthesis ABC-type transport system permease subunit